MKKIIRKVFGLRNDIGIRFYIADFFFRKILLQNPEVTWAIHFKSKIIFPKNIVRGKNVYPGDSPGNFINASNGILIGDYTNIGPNVGIISANHDVIDNSKFVESSPIKIGAFCWIAMNVVILPAVELGDFTVVGANAVVTKSFKEGHCVIAGNPAVIIRNLDKNECELYRQSKI
jgi:acetyltransferase-like isoleucine patch superfamily enzyme